MIVMGKYFVDSTVWVEFFNGADERVKIFLTPKIDEDRVFYNGIILCELLIGALTKKEHEFLKSSFDGFHYLEISNKTFECAGRLGFDLRRKGITIPLTDLIIAAHCMEHKLKLVTLDRHFSMIKTHTTLGLEDFNLEA
jgi:predicted nucleic acid-binding protein